MEHKDPNSLEPHYEQIRSVIVYSRYPFCKTEHLHILKEDDLLHFQMMNKREIDETGTFTTTLGSERFKESLVMRHPLITDAILTAEQVLFEPIDAYRSHIESNDLSGSALRSLQDAALGEWNKSDGAFQCDILSEARYTLYWSAWILAFAIHYRQSPDVITTKDLFSAYPEATVHAAYEYLSEKSTNRNQMHNILSEIRKQIDKEKRYIKMLSATI